MSKADLLARAAEHDIQGRSKMTKPQLVTAIADAPADAAPLDAIARGLDAMADLFEELGGDRPRKRQAIINARSPAKRRIRHIVAAARKLREGR